MKDSIKLVKVQFWEDGEWSTKEIPNTYPHIVIIDDKNYIRNDSGGNYHYIRANTSYNTNKDTMI